MASSNSNSNNNALISSIFRNDSPNWTLSTAMGIIWLAGFSAGTSLTMLLYSLFQRDKEQPEVDIKKIKLVEKKNKSQKFMEDLERQFHVSSSKLYDIMRHFIHEMELGLTETGSSMKMIPSFVERLPTGKERGTVLALDLGGSNFRVVQVLLDGSGQVRTQQKKFNVGDTLKTGPADELFDFLADCIQSFLDEMNMGRNDDQALGFTFSFPVDQVSLNKGELIEWTKGFTCSGAEHNDVVEMLSNALKRKNIGVIVTALVNDTVGTLVAHAYKDPKTAVSVILGTGSNAAYIEKLSDIPKWKNGPNKTNQMIVNMEWGGFDSKSKRVLPLTSYDIRLDQESPHPGTQLYEKMISGMYLGEIARIVLSVMSSEGHIFSGKTSLQLETKYGLDTKLLTRIERDHSADLQDTKAVLEEVLGINETSTEDRYIVKRVCELVGIRAARLCAAGIAGIVTKTNHLSGCTVAIDGSVFEKYPHFTNRMNDALIELFGISAENIKMTLAQDGSGIGAGLIAYLAAQKG